MGSPHALVIPYPAQGHVIPLMALSHLLVDHGFKVSFINTEFNQRRIIAALSDKGGDGVEGIEMVSLPDGLAPDDDRSNSGKLMEGCLKVMPGRLEELIKKINASEGDKVTRIVADGAVPWALAVARKMGIRSAAFWPASTAVFAMFQSIPKMIRDGIVDADGTIKQNESFQLSPGMPSMNTSHLPWNIPHDLQTQESLFKYVSSTSEERPLAETIICNSFYDLEPSSFAFCPNLLPVGPLLTSQWSGKAVGHLWPDDATSMSWLDEQPANSVIYVASGSLTVLNHQQFQELALGLGLSGHSFLWVVRPNLTNGIDNTWLDGFRDQVKGRGKLVEWSPQQQVLAHPSVACFFSHCGWNSTLEGMKNGVSFLCWPYWADQFFNQTYICDIWKTGLRIEPDNKGLVPREQIKEKIRQLFRDEETKARALMWKDIADRSIKEGGSSYKNLKSFIDALKE